MSVPTVDSFPNSPFTTWGMVTGGIPGTAPQIFVAATPDDLAAVTASGYLNNFGVRVKQNDVFYINYSDTSVQPVGGANANEAATLGEFYVNISGSNINLVSALTALGTAAAKNVTDNTKSLVASVSGSFVIDNFTWALDTSGTIGDSGYNVNNIQQYASVAITAAEFNGMYAAPKLLIAAPGANMQIIVDQMELVMTFVSAQYAAGGVVAAQYDSTVHGAGVLATATEAAADFTGAAASTTFRSFGSTAVAPFTTTVNKGIYLSNASGAFTTGDSTFVAKIHYRIVATA
jgi:hypothetical protein